MKGFLAKSWNWIVEGAAAIGGFLSALYGGWDTPLAVLVGVMAIDYVSGLIVAAMGKSGKSDSGGLDSKVGWKGIMKKVMTLLVVLVAVFVDRSIAPDSVILRNTACWFFVANEGISIMENSALAGVPWPDKLKEMLSQLGKKDDEVNG